MTAARTSPRDLYRGRDPRLIPAYDAAMVMRYLHIPKTTLQHWTHAYRSSTGRVVTPIVRPDDVDGALLSFANLIELHVLCALRREHQVSLLAIRSAVEYLQRELSSPRPLLEQGLETDGAHVFVEHFGQLLNATRHGQAAMPDVIRAYLKRIERDPTGMPIRLFPFTHAHAALTAPRLIAIDPAVAFGRPVIAGSRVSTREVFERFKLGESSAELANDFSRPLEAIEEAIRLETGEAA